MFKIFIPLFQIILVFNLVHSVTAQEQNELHLRMIRTFGYSSGTGKIQGTFTLKASGPEDLELVVFYIDDVIIGQSVQVPHNVRFNTSNYALGKHRILAIGRAANGRQLQSNEIQAIFVTAEEGVQAAVKIIIPLLGFIFLAALISFGITMLTGRKMKDLSPGTQRNYGVAGGAICPQCRRPYARHFWSPNLLVGKLERCPFCGMWAIVAASPIDKLRSAERAEVNSNPKSVAISLETDSDRFRKELEDSRFQDL